MAGNNNLPASLRQPIRLIITEIIPQILVSDGYHLVEAIFTSECINDLKRGGYQKEFTRLRDKVIFVSKWSLQVDCADSQVDYHSFENFKIRLVIEQFTPKLHENFQKTLSYAAKSIYKCNEDNEKIQPLIQNFRHWILQNLICKSAWSQNKSQQYFENINAKNGSKKHSESVIDFDQECCDIQMPSWREVMCQQQNVFQNNVIQNGIQQNQKQQELQGEKNKYKKRINTANQSHNSQNTTQQSINDPLLNGANTIQNDEILEEDKNDNYQKFGGQIQSSEVFRYKQLDFVDSDRIRDKFGEFEEFKEQILLKKKQQGKDCREFDIQRTILQEQGELAYEQKSKSKSIQWLDLVQDERIREQIKCKIDYFQIGSENLLDNLQSTLQSKDAQGGLNLRNTRKLVGYKIERKASQMKEKLIEIKDKYKDTILNANKKRMIPNIFQKGNRPRANSQEDILQLRDESQCDNIMENTTKIKKREGLSQNIYQKNYEMDNETQSEKSDMDSELEGQFKLEKQGKVQKKVSELDQALNQCQANIGIYNNYLQWMQNFKIASIESFNKINDDMNDNKQEKVKKNEQSLAKKRNEHRISRKATKYVDDGDDFRYFQKYQEEEVQQVELIKEDDKMETWSEQKEDKNKDINQLDDYQYQQNLQLESLSQSSESVKEQDIEMKDLEEEQIVQSSQNNQLNLIADSSSSTNVNNTLATQNVIQSTLIIYRPPYIEPKIMDPTQVKFIFEYNKSPPQPPKPIQEMSQCEQQFFDMEMEEYNNCRDLEERKMKQGFIKQQKELLFLKLKEDQQRNNEKTQMSIEDFESRKMLQQYQLEQEQKIQEKQNRQILLQQQQEKFENEQIQQQQEKEKFEKEQIQQQQEQENIDYEQRQQAQKFNQMNVQVHFQKYLKQQYREMVQSDDQKNENEESIQTVSEQSEQHSEKKNHDSIENRRAYADQMTKKLGRVFDREISKCTQRDMQLRDYKSQENTDKRHDVLKAFEDKQNKNERFNQIRQRAQSGILMQKEELDLESQKSPKFQSLEDAEKELNNKEFLKSDDKKNTEQSLKHKENKHGVEDDFPSFQENHEEADHNQMVVDQSQHESPKKQENDDQEEQEDEWDEPNGTQNDNGYNNQDEEEAQNESYEQQKSEEYEDQNSNERAEDPQLFNNQEIKQEQDVVEIESSLNEDQEESEDEVLELQSQNNIRNNQYQQQNFQKNQFEGNQQNSMQRQLIQTPPQQNKMNAYGNQHQSSSKVMGIPQKIDSERQNNNNQQFIKTKPQLLAQSPKKGQYIQQVDEDQLQENDDLLGKYQNDLKKVQIQLNQIQSELKVNKQQNQPMLKNQQQKLIRNFNYLQDKIQTLNQPKNISDPKLFKGRQNFNGEYQNQQREQNDSQMKRNFSPSKNTPHFPVGSQRSNSQMRPEHFEQQKNFNERKYNNVDQKQQGNMHKNQFYHKQNNNMRKMNQNYQNEIGYPENEDDCDQYSEENGPQEQAEMNDDNQQAIQEIDQEPILIEQEEEEYHVPSFGSQVKQNRDEIGSTQQRNFRNNQSSGNKRIQRSKSPENNPSGYRVQPFSVNGEDDEEDQDQQQMQMPIIDQRQKLVMQSMKPEQYFNQNVGQKRNFQQYNNPQSNQMIRNRARSVSQSRPEISSRQNHQFMNQNGYYQGYDRNQMEMQREKEVNYTNLSEYADHYIKDVHKENVFSSAKQQDIKRLQHKISQKQQYLQQLQNSKQQKQIQVDQDEDQEQDNRMYDKNIRNDKIVKQFPKNPLLANQFNPNQRMQQQNIQNRNFNDHQFNDAKGYKNINQGEKMQQRPMQVAGLTPQKIQAIQQQYSQNQCNNLRSNQQIKPPQNNFRQPRHDQIPHKNLQPLIPPQKRIPIIPQDQINEPIRAVSSNNLSSGKAINSLSSKKNYVAQTVDDPDEDENISIIYPQKKIMQDDPRKQQQMPQKFQNIEKYQQSNGNMIGFGNKRQYGGNGQMQNQNDYGMNQKKQKLISENTVNNQFPKQNQHSYKYNQFEGNQAPRMKQMGPVQKGVHGPVDQADVNLEEEQVQQQFPVKRRRLE